MSRSDAIGILLALAKLWFDSVSLVDKCGGDIYVLYLDIAFVPPDTLWMIEAVCGVGENWNVQIWLGQGFEADGGSHSWHVHPSVKKIYSFDICFNV